MNQDGGEKRVLVKVVYGKGPTECGMISVEDGYDLNNCIDTFVEEQGLQKYREKLAPLLVNEILKAISKKPDLKLRTAEEKAQDEAELKRRAFKRNARVIRDITAQHRSVQKKQLRQNSNNDASRTGNKGKATRKAWNSNTKPITTKRRHVRRRQVKTRGGGLERGKQQSSLHHSGKDKTPVHEEKPKSLVTHSSLDEEDENSVFNRLYGHASIRRDRRATLSILAEEEEMKSCTFNPSITFKGEHVQNERLSPSKGMNASLRLYENHRIRKDRLNDMQTQREQLKEESEEQECTFHPKISDYAHSIRHIQENKIREKNRRRSEQRMESIQRENERKQVAECTFQPKINEKSQRIVADRRRNRDSRKNERERAKQLPYGPDSLMRKLNLADDEYETKVNGDGKGETIAQKSETESMKRSMDLYEDSVRRRTREKIYRDVIEQAYTYSPNIGSETYRPRKEKSREEFFERMYLAGIERKKRIAEDRRLAERVDLTTGQELFKPKINRAPNYTRFRNGMSICDYLYATRHQSKDIKDRLRKLRNADQQKGLMKKHITKKSDELVQKMWHRKFGEMFELLVTVERMKKGNPMKGEGQVLENGSASSGKSKSKSHTNSSQSSSQSEQKQNDSGKGKKSTTPSVVDLRCFTPDDLAKLGNVEFQQHIATLQRVGKGTITRESFIEQMFEVFKNKATSGGIPSSSMFHNDQRMEEIDRCLEEEKRAHTFKPTLIKSVHTHASNRDFAGSFLERVAAKETAKVNKLKALRKEKWDKEVDSCTFKPKLISKAPMEVVRKNLEKSKGEGKE
eukprot:g4271.t1